MYRNPVRIALLLAITLTNSEAQNFSSGPIPMCDTSYFTANVTGIGFLEPPGSGWGFSLSQIGIDITSNHPQTLVISVTSPAGITLLLSAYNGAGGSDYTNCIFGYSGYPLITTGSAPFTGTWTAQGGSLNVFDYTLADGTWTITVIDTSCQYLSGGGPGGWSSGYFDGSGATTGMGFSANSPPCPDYLPWGWTDICPGGSFDLLGYYNSYNPFYTYSFTLSGSPVPNPSAVTIAGTYDIFGYDAWTGCSYWANYAINVISSINLGPDQSYNLCAYETLDLTTLYNTTGYSPSWLFNGLPCPGPQSVNAAGTYTLIAGQNTCYDTALVTLNSLPTPALGPDQTANGCSGYTIDLTNIYNTAGSNASWSLAGTAVANPSAVTSGGIYTLIVTSPSGCSDTADFTLSIIPSPALGADQSYDLCNYDVLDLIPLYSISNYAYSWTLNGVPFMNPGAASAAGSYILTVIDTTGCTDTAQVIINSLPTPALGPDQAFSICSVNMLDLTGIYTTTGFSSLWTINGIPVVNPAAVNNTGNYMLVAISPAGCADTANVSLNMLPTPALGPDQLYDICSNTTLDLGQLYNTSGNTAVWTLNGSVVLNPASVNAAGSYMLTVTAMNGCSDTAIVALNSYAAPALGVDQNLSACDGNTVDLTSLFNTSGYNTSWTQAGLPVVNPGSVSVTGSYTIVATSFDGCSDTAVVNLTVNPNPAPGPDKQVPVCDGGTIDLNSYFNTAGYAVIWTFGGIMVNNSAAVNQAGIYLVTATSNAGCTATATLSLTVNPAPALGPDVAINICSGDVTSLTGIFNTAGLIKTWTESGNTVPNPAAINTSGNYQLIATNAFGCSDTGVVNHNVFPTPDLGPDQSYALCDWMTIDLGTLYDTTGLASIWTFNGIPPANYAAVHDSGTYTISVTDSNGCTDEAQVIITNIACQCRADFSYAGNCRQDPFSFRIIADSALENVSWRFSSSAMPELHELAPEVKLLTDDSILVTLEAVMGCGIVLVEKYVQVNDCSDSCRLYFPEAFTPNYDGINDRFTWYGECMPQYYLLEVHNRYGQLVYRTNDPSASWDGRFKNAIAPVDVYVYHVEYKLPYQDRQTILNKLTLFR